MELNSPLPADSILIISGYALVFLDMRHFINKLIDICANIG